MLFFKYPGDIDLFEKILSEQPRNKFIENTVSRIKTIVQSIILSDNIYFIEFKAGEDTRFDFDVIFSDDTQTNNLRKLLGQLVMWSKQHLITNDELINITILIKKYKSLTQNDIHEIHSLRDNIKKAVRELKMLRWTTSELIEGKKKLRGSDDTYMTLYNAINMNTVTKLDTIVWYQNRYIEMTNFFYFELVDKNTGTKTIISEPFPNYLKSLNSDIKKYSGCGEYPKDSLKMLKRMFIKDALLYKSSKSSDLIKELNELANIINQAPGALSQIKADFEALDNLLSTIKNVNVTRVCTMLNSMTKRYNNNIIDSTLAKKFNQKKDQLFILYAEYQTYVNQNDHQKRDQMFSIFLEVINKFIDESLKELKLMINAQTEILISNSNIKTSCDLFMNF